MRILAWVLIVLCIFTVLIPLRDYNDDEVFNFSTIKRSIEGISDYQDSFLADISRLGFLGEVLSLAVTEQKNVEILYATRFQYESSSQGRSEFVVDGETTIFKLRVYRSEFGAQYDDISFVTPITWSSDNYDEYLNYVDSLTRPIALFIDAWNSFVDAPWYSVLLDSIALVASGIYMIIYILIAFLFDSITMLWGVLLCALRILGVVPLPA